MYQFRVREHFRNSKSSGHWSPWRGFIVQEPVILYELKHPFLRVPMPGGSKSVEVTVGQSVKFGKSKLPDFANTPPAIHTFAANRPSGVRNVRVPTPAIRGFAPATRGFAVSRSGSNARIPALGSIKRLNGLVAKILPPDIQVISETYYVDKACTNTNRLIVFDVTVRNNGGPLGSQKWSLYVTELGGTGLGSRSAWVSPLAPGLLTQVTIPVVVLKSRIGQLPVRHSLKIVSLDVLTGSKTTTFVTITLPKNICQLPKLQVRLPSQMHMKLMTVSPQIRLKKPRKKKDGVHPGSLSGARALNPQPEPPSLTTRRLQLSIPQLQGNLHIK
ncbi:MAG TPA: hypothetical protein ENI62_08740 [Gammaproteobacteria bacterium]|nr:hypothetical protein [Gammaproteobacteria bacterium]